jgi:hypothetical protein
MLCWTRVFGVNLYVSKKNAGSHEDGAGEVDGSTSHEIDAWAIDF